MWHFLCNYFLSNKALVLTLLFNRLLFKLYRKCLVTDTNLSYLLAIKSMYLNCGGTTLSTKNTVFSRGRQNKRELPIFVTTINKGLLYSNQQSNRSYHIPSPEYSLLDASAFEAGPKWSFEEHLQTSSAFLALKISARIQQIAKCPLEKGGNVCKWHPRAERGDWCAHCQRHTQEAWKCSVSCSVPTATPGRGSGRAFRKEQGKGGGRQSHWEGCGTQWWYRPLVPSGL